MRSDGRRRAPPGPQALALIVAAATAVLTASLAFQVPLPNSGRPLRRLRPLAAAATETAPAPASVGILGDLLELTKTSTEETLMEKVDVDFGRITPDDMNSLRTRLQVASEEEKAQLFLLTKCIQTCMEKRMESATQDIDALMMSSGDIDENIRETLGKQDSPLPILAVLQMNIEKTKREGLETQERALTFILQKINLELEQAIPIETRVLTELLSITDAEARRDYLRKHLTQPKSSVCRADPIDLARAVVKLVDDVNLRFGEVGNDAGASTRNSQLVLLKEVAFDAAVVVEEVEGEDVQNAFTEQLLPLFEAITEDSS